MKVALQPAPSRNDIEALASGSALAMKRPTPGVAFLSLWLDVGARDAKAPQLATAAGFWAGEKVAARARVTAEGTELRMVCETAREPVASCAARLVKALELGTPTTAEALKLREQVRKARAQAAQDDARSAEQLALRALLGGAAEPLSPLGEERDDAAIDATALQAFVTSHYGVGRALLVGVGDLEQVDLERALRKLRRREGLAARLREPLRFGSALRVEVADSAQIALVLPTGGVEQAASLCQRFRAIHADASAHVSLLHGATLAHLTLPAGAEPYARLQSAVFDVHRLLREQTTQAALPPPDSLDELARAVGERWIARGGAQREVSALGVALLVRRDERTPASEHDMLSKAVERAASAVAAGARNSVGSFSGDLGPNGGRVRTENGASITIERRVGEAWFSAALRLSGGSELDAPTGHGRAALLATLLADGCGIAHGRALDLHLTTLEARLTPLLDAEGLGVVISAPRARADEALDLLLRCALRPMFQARALEDARARLLQSLWSDDALLLSAALGQLLAPAAPGLVAPWGTPLGVGKVELGELKRFHAQRLQAANIAVWIAGDLPPRETAERVARRLAYLPAAEPAPIVAQAGATPEILAALVGDTRLRVLVGVRSASGHRGQLGAQVFAAELQRALARRVGTDSFATGRSARGHSFAGVALTLRDDQIEATKAHAEAALRELAELPDAPLRSALIAAHAAQSARLSSAKLAAEAALLGQSADPLDFAAELALIRKLAHEAPRFFVLRPRP